MLQVQCLDSRGVKHKQLVKSGNDDLRQDAVMQQFFALVNNVLQASASTRKRQLHMVTYRVRLPNHQCAVSCISSRVWTKGTVRNRHPLPMNVICHS